MILHRTQAEVGQDTHRFRVVCCGRRWGKTTEAIEEIKGFALSCKENEKIAYIAPTYQQARDIAWEELKRELAPITKRVNESRLELEVYNKDKKSVLIVLRGWESIETLRGQKFKFIVIDEIASMRNFQRVWEEVIRPTLTDLQGECLFISTPKGFNHFYELFCMDPSQPKAYPEQKQDADYKSFHFTSYDNPHIKKEELDKAKQELTEDRFSQEYLADFRKTEGLVYKEFDRTRHTFNNKSDVINPISKIAGVDFGFTNPTVILEIVKDYDNTFWVVSEWYKTGKTNEEVIEYCKTLKINYWYPDPAEPDRIEEMKRAGLNVREVNKDIEKGIDTVRSLLKNGKLKIHSSCVNLIDEFQTYTYKEKRPDNNEPEEPVKEHDHALDALRYAMFMQNPSLNTSLKAKQFIPRNLDRGNKMVDYINKTQWLDKH